jgi:hypothetical protein
VTQDAEDEQLRGLLAFLSAEAPPEIDLTDPEHEGWVMSAADRIGKMATGSEKVEALDGQLAGGSVPVACGLAVKLALSRARVRGLVEPAHLSVVLAVYKEHIRILRRAAHPHGEDFLRRKLDQLRWLFEGTPHTWDLTVVDDGCPDGSGRIAEEILASDAPDADAHVLFLESAIRQGLPVVSGLSSTDQSRKGGSVRYGMWHAAQTARANHVILFTDADLSTHLGQSGLLMAPILEGRAASAVGSRREPTSVVVKAGQRNTRGKLFIYLWKSLTAPLADIVDTQCGFKAFAPGPLNAWFTGAIESGFAFDIELLLNVQLARPGSIEKVGIAWIDSDAQSTTADLEPYLDMLRMVVRFYRSYLPADARADGFAQLIEALDQHAFDRLLNDLPGAIADADPAMFGDFEGVDAAELRSRAGLSC